MGGVCGSRSQTVQTVSPAAPHTVATDDSEVPQLQRRSELGENHMSTPGGVVSGDSTAMISEGVSVDPMRGAERAPSPIIRPGEVGPGGDLCTPSPLKVSQSIVVQEDPQEEPLSMVSVSPDPPKPPVVEVKAPSRSNEGGTTAEESGPAGAPAADAPVSTPPAPAPAHAPASVPIAATIPALPKAAPVPTGVTIAVPRKSAPVSLAAAHRQHAAAMAAASAAGGSGLAGTGTGTVVAGTGLLAASSAPLSVAAQNLRRGSFAVVEVEPVDAKFVRRAGEAGHAILGLEHPERDSAGLFRLVDGRKCYLELPQCAEPHDLQLGNLEVPSLPAIQRGEELGRGSFGAVYKSMLPDGSFVAIKEVFVTSKDAVKEVKDLENEINIMARLNHRNIVRYVGSSRTGTSLSIAIELVSGGSLASIIKQYSFLQERVVSKYGVQLLEGLRYLHSHGIIHRDVKSANVLVDGSGTIKLADFGCGSLLDGGLVKGELKGSPFWMAPEVIRKKDFRSSGDVWSLGATLYECVTGNPPWSDSPDPASVMWRIGSSKTPPPIPISTSDPLRDFLLLCFERDPNKRASATQLLMHPFIVFEGNTVPGFVPWAVEVMGDLDVCDDAPVSDSEEEYQDLVEAEHVDVQVVDVPLML